MARMANRVASLGTTVFSEFSALANRHQAVNLGQGFPDFDAPEVLKEAARQAIADGVNQYPVGAGDPLLRRAIAEHARRFYRQEINPETMVSVTSGATEGIFDALLGLLNPGDEVVAFEPFYDSYLAAVGIAGATVRCVRLRPPEPEHPTWWYEPDELRDAFSEKTALVLLNTPHNPTGKVFSRPELEQVAALVERHDASVLVDEVYEHLTYEVPHVRFASLPGMHERTLTLSSAGKTFSVTGWKVGWAIGPPELRDALQRMHQFVTFATAAPFQRAVGQALALPDSYFKELRTRYQERRDKLAQSISACGLRPYSPEGAYFIVADVSALGFPDDQVFCRFLTTEVKVAAIPPSAFYCEAHRAHAKGLARFAFCKSDAVLDEAGRRLLSLPELARRSLAAPGV